MAVVPAHVHACTQGAAQPHGGVACARVCFGVRRWDSAGCECEGTGRDRGGARQEWRTAVEDLRARRQIRCGLKRAVVFALGQKSNETRNGSLKRRACLPCLPAWHGACRAGPARPDPECPSHHPRHHTPLTCAFDLETHTSARAAGSARSAHLLRRRVCQRGMGDRNLI